MSALREHEVSAPAPRPTLTRPSTADALLSRYEEMRVPVRRRVRGRIGGLSEDSFDSAYNTVWARLYSQQSRPDASALGDLGDYLAQAVRNQALNDQRAERSWQEATRHDGGWDGTQDETAELASPTGDPAVAVEERTTMREILEALCRELTVDERKVLWLVWACGTTMEEAAQRAGVSLRQARKVLHGAGGRLSASARVRPLLDTISRGDWCEAQQSLMAAYATGVLDPDGERYGQAEHHLEHCPACRAYVRSLRGMAALLPPLPLLGALGAGAGSGVGPLHHLLDTLTGWAGHGRQRVTELVSHHGSETTAAGGVGAAGGGALLAGVAGKVAIGCVAAGLVTGACVATGLLPGAPATPRPHARPAVTHHAPRVAPADSGPVAPRVAQPHGSRHAPVRPPRPARHHVATPAPSQDGLLDPPPSAPTPAASTPSPTPSAPPPSSPPPSSSNSGSSSSPDLLAP